MKSVLLCGWSGPRFVSKSGGRFRDVNLLGQQDAHLIFLLWSGAMAMVSGVDVLGVPPPSPRPPVALQTLPLCPGLHAATRACSALEEPCNECPWADFIRYPQEFTDAPLCPFAVAGTLDHRVSRDPPWWLDWQHTWLTSFPFPVSLPRSPTCVLRFTSQMNPHTQILVSRNASGEPKVRHSSFFQEKKKLIL